MTSTRQRHDTLFRQFIRQLFWPMLFTVGLAMAANILVGYTMAQNEQLNHQRIIETAYAQALLKPLWDCDDKAAQAILDATLQNTIVSGVSLTSACTSSRLHSGTTQDTTQGEETTLVYTDKTGRRFTVGSMSMAFKPVSIMQSATDSLSAYLLITAAMALCMAVVALRIFRTLISQPLTAFQRIIGGSATSRKDDALHTRLTTHRNDELTDVIKAYDRLMDTIDSQRMALERQARVDPLTGLGNRLMLEERLNAAKTRARRHMGRGYILLIDLDNFKPINDVLGHAAGDFVLQNTARRLRDIVREEDAVIRLGGDEFVLIIEARTPQDDADELAERVRSALSRPLEYEGRSVAVGASVGYTAFDGGDESCDTLLTRADQAMYAQKTTRKAGR